MTQAGRFNRQITIDKPVITKDATYGSAVKTWEPLSPVAGTSPAVGERFWAQVMDVQPSRSESVRLGLEVARNQTRVRIRWRNDVTSDMRVTVHGDTDVIYQIVGGPAEVGGRKEMLEMVCERYVPGGDA